MNIKELIERVLLTDEEIDNNWPDETPEYDTIRETLEKGILIGSKAIAQAATNKVLNDPDLYVIDEKRTRLLGYGGFTNVYPVIPLSEAIKEAQDE